MPDEAAIQRLEKILLEREILSETEIAEARAYGEEHGTSLVEALVKLEALGWDDVSALLAESSNLRTLKLEDIDIDRESVRHVPATIAYRHTLIPVRRSGNALVVVIADPTNAAAREALTNVTDFEVVPFGGHPETIEHALHIHYGEPPEAEIPADQADVESSSDRLASFVVDERYAHIGRSMPLRRSFTFESFIEDAGNQYPLNLARTLVSGQPEERVCPTILQGKPGCGKTHLLHAIANYLIAKEPLEKFILINGEHFAKSLFDCVRNRRINLFRYFYRDCKYILLDDYDALLTRAWAQKELAATVQNLRDHEGWIVMAGNADLATDGRLVPELRSQIENGDCAQFAEYSLEGRIKIVQREIGDVVIAPDTLARLSSEFDGSMSDVLEIARQFAAMSILESREVTDEVITDFLALHGSKEADKSPANSKRKQSKHSSSAGGEA